MIEIVSIHIPKTAGRSFLTILNEVYDAGIVSHFDKKNYPRNSPSAISMHIKNLDKNVRVIHGHFTFREISTIDNEKCKFITWLRDPVERVISNYSFFKKRIAENQPDAELQNRKNETLLQYAALENSRNRMSKFIEGKNPCDFYFIGLTERFESDIHILAGMLGWKNFDVPHINTNADFKSSLPPVTEYERQKIKELNLSDIKLYNEVLELKLRKG